VVSERDTLKTTLARLQIEDGSVADATKRGLRSSALEDLKAQALKVFPLVDGVPKALAVDGRTAHLGKDGVTSLDWPTSARLIRIARASRAPTPTLLRGR
jgi:hypothetical protein